MNILKKYWPDLLAIALFVVIAFAYFFVPVTQGKVLFQHDAAASVGLNHELTQFHEQTGEETLWTNSVFGGMPTYQIAPSYQSTKGLSAIMGTYHLWLPNYVWFLFAYLLGFYIMLRAFDFRQSLAALGSVVWAFSSYFLIIIAAGHLWKVAALAYLPPMIGGIVLAYRGKYLAGLAVTAIFAAFEIKANHAQMTYYYFFVVFFMLIAYLYQAIRDKQISRFLKATGVCVVAAGIALAINASNLYHTWEYQKDSMRGKSELTSKGNAANQTNSGLDRDYITQWSYGIGETWTLLIPNAKGGSHNEKLGNNKSAMQASDPQLADVCSQWYQYWGDQPFTAGPVYVGAFVLMLFILGLFMVKGPMKWALLAATVLSVLLSWGRNFMPFTNFFIDYIPLYSKFRTVSSILVIAEFTIPLLAMLTLKKIVDEPEVLTKKIKFVYLSFVLTAGVALLFALMPNVFFDFVSQADMQNLTKSGIPQEYLQDVANNIGRMRVPIFTSDCWRTVVIILIGTLMLLLFKAKKLKVQYMLGGIFVLCLIDMWQVDKRYLNDGMFVPKSQAESEQQKTQADEQILQDPSADYRVLNLTGDTFNENNTSYYHKSIGGYHPAKLHRYQDMISTYIGPEMQRLNKLKMSQNGNLLQVTDENNQIPVLDMLNTKYLIAGINNQPTAVKNTSAYGNGWFVNKVNYVDNADQEIAMVGKINLRHEAVADKRFQQQLGVSQNNNSSAVVTLTSYAPNHLKYDVNSKNGGVVVLSEVYYPGWTATVDGQDVTLGKVNYILRALNVKAGKHTVELDFHPSSVRTTETIAYVGFALLVLIVAGAIFLEWKKNRKTIA